MKPDYILNEDYLDLVFRHMYEMRGRYGSTKTIHTELEKNYSKKFHYNDIVMALEQLALDGFLNLEPNKWDEFSVYRLTYKGYLEYRSSKSSRPYKDLIKRNISRKRYNRSKQIAIIVNAIAILAITGMSLYVDQKGSKNSEQISNIEDRILNIEKKLDKINSDSITIKLIDE
ncbi:hypothetical protein ACE01N_20595 [Saccharicrinis sp. FJH2]|uniref:hypothetical protein n=1 Tax=Saccharicrinis sp. FJH65 TaxID=3344659 RepID=UPI0035F262A7